MKKRLLLLVMTVCFLLCGCGKPTENSVMKDLTKKVDTKGYYLQGNLEIVNNEDVYTYDVNVSYKKEDMFRVVLKNLANNHEQIILRNADGVYVLTPSLNKSFKFQSEWPYNNSQIYILQQLLDDIKSDNNRKFVQKNNQYEFLVKANYPNNKLLQKQTITFDKNLKIKQVVITDDNDQEHMRVKFNKVDMKANFDDKYFALSENMKVSGDVSSEKQVTKLEDVVYPMYMPENTSLQSQDKVSKDIGERVILTFGGDSPFMLVEETANYQDEMEIIPTYGEPAMLGGSVGAVTDSSITWSSNGVEYYLVSDVLDTDELLQVANSIGNLPVMK